MGISTVAFRVGGVGLELPAAGSLATDPSEELPVPAKGKLHQGETLLLFFPGQYQRLLCKINVYDP